MGRIEHTWRILHRTDLGHRHDWLIPEGAPIPEPDAELRVIEVVPADQLAGAVDRLALVERELRAAAVEWRNAEELDGRTIRDDFNRIANLAGGQ
jgi:hypothetical protein